MRPRLGDALTRRSVLQGLIGVLAPAAMGQGVRAAQATSGEAMPYSSAMLPPGIRSRFVNDVNGIRMHILEAGFESPGRPGVLLLHGFPELAYSWRKIMGPITAGGFHVFAPDVRGHGRTSGAEVKYTDDLRPFGSINKVRDMLSLVSALGYRSLAGVIGHDQGSPLAGWCALARPDVFRSVVMMSAPFGGPPALPFNTANASRAVTLGLNADAIYDELAALTPSAQALSAVLHNERSQRQHVAPEAGHTRVPARVLPHEKRRLETEHPVSACGENRDRMGKAAAVLRHGSG